MKNKNIEDSKIADFLISKWLKGLEGDSPSNKELRKGVIDTLCDHKNNKGISDDYAIMGTLVRMDRSGVLLSCASNRLREDKDWLMDLLRIQPSCLKSFSEKLLKDEDFILDLVDIIPDAVVNFDLSATPFSNTLAEKIVKKLEEKFILDRVSNPKSIEQRGSCFT